MNDLNELVVGIDLGNTNTTLAWVDEYGCAQVIPNMEGDDHTPSCVQLENGLYTIGRVPERQALERPDDVMRDINSRLGTDFRFPNQKAPEEVAAQIIKKVVKDAEASLGEPIRRAVIGYPDHFEFKQVEAVRKAGMLAGLTSVDLVSESIAAAVSFGVGDTENVDQVLLCDLGGTSYKVAALQLSIAKLRVLAAGCSVGLGGRYWTHTLVDLIAGRVQVQTGVAPRIDPHSLQALYVDAEAAKRQLSVMQECNVTCSSGRQIIGIPVTRSEFEEACAPLIDAIATKTQQMVADAHLSPVDFQHVLLVGGASRMPCVIEAITRATGLKPKQTRQPSGAVACGAALLAKGRSKRKFRVKSTVCIQSVAVHALGTHVTDANANPPQIVNLILLHENASLPAFLEQIFFVAPGQRRLEIPLYHFDAKGNIHDVVGNYVFHLAERDHEYALKVRIEVSEIQSVRVQAEDVELSQLLSAVPESIQGSELARLAPTRSSEHLHASLSDGVERETPAPKQSTPIDDNVQFTVYQPKAVQPLKWYDLLVFAHLSEKPIDAPQDTPNPVAEVARQAKQILGDQAATFLNLTQNSLLAVPRKAELTFVPIVAGVEFNPDRQTVTWQEAFHRREFRMRANAELDGSTARGRLTIYWGPLILADVSLVFRVGNHLTSAELSQPRESISVRPYRKIFASYSHKDMDIVEHVEKYFRTVGDEYLRDRKDLRAGEIWNERLMAMIEEADIFQLFWSKNSMVSKYVQQEWEHALSLGRANFVRPTYWENPMPRSESPPLPPAELAQIEFHEISSILLPKPSSPEAKSDRATLPSGPLNTPVFCQVACPTCKYTFVVPSDSLGTRIVCTNCQSTFLTGAEPGRTMPQQPAETAAPKKTMFGDESPPIRYNCPRCKKALESHPGEAGTKKPCPSCGQRLQVPAAPPNAMFPPPLNKTLLASGNSIVASSRHAEPVLAKSNEGRRRRGFDLWTYVIVFFLMITVAIGIVWLWRYWFE